MADRPGRQEYTVGWVCALPTELTAAQEMFDEEHPDLPSQDHDTNIYSLGRIGDHNIVLAALPAGQTGIAPATAAAMQMRRSFPAIRFGLMVGIGGGNLRKNADIRLGDVVISQPEKGHGGVIQYDFCKSTPTGFEQTGFLNAPPQVLLSAVTKLRALHDRDRNSLSPHLLKLSRLSEFVRDEASDVLFDNEYDHEGDDDCSSCKRTKQTSSDERTTKDPVIHYSTIASANMVMRDGKTRDEVSLAFKGVLCFEMEAAGLMNNLPCLVIRGICDYADSHKNKKWQPYAVSTAAAYTKELLSVIPAADVTNTQTVDEATKG